MLLERIGKLAPHIFHIFFTKQDGKHRKPMISLGYYIPLWMFHNYLLRFPQGEQQNVNAVIFYMKNGDFTEIGDLTNLKMWESKQ